MQPGTTATSKRVLRIKQLSQIIGLARSTIYDYLDPMSPRHDPTFPKPIKLGASAVGWLEAEINQWIGLKIAMRSAVTPSPL